MIICGIDPGLNKTGYGIIDVKGKDLILVDAGIISTNRHFPLYLRLNQLYDELSSLISEFSVDVLAIEEVYSHYKHPRTAILMGHARGIILLSAVRRGVKIKGFTATKIKKAITGNGRASKLQLKRSILSRFGLKGTGDIPSDATDALAVAVCCCEHMDT